jgi:hypothetical protein
MKRKYAETAEERRARLAREREERKRNGGNLENFNYNGGGADDKFVAKELERRRLLAEKKLLISHNDRIELTLAHDGF